MGRIKPINNYPIQYDFEQVPKKQQKPTRKHKSKKLGNYRNQFLVFDSRPIIEEPVPVIKINIVAGKCLLYPIFEDEVNVQSKQRFTKMYGI